METVLMTPIGHPLTAERQVTLNEIVKYPLILTTEEPGICRSLGLGRAA